MHTFFNKTIPEISFLLRKNLWLKVLVTIFSIFFFCYIVGYVSHFIWNLVA